MIICCRCRSLARLICPEPDERPVERKLVEHEPEETSGVASDLEDPTPSTPPPPPRQPRVRFRSIVDVITFVLPERFRLGFRRRRSTAESAIAVERHVEYLADHEETAH